MMKRLALVCLLFAMQAQAATLSGIVTDSEGAAISKAHIIVHWDSSGSTYLPNNLGLKQDLTMTTDENGQFSADVPEGFYDLFVAAGAFSPHCEKIRLTGKSKSFKIKLPVSPVVSKELD